MSVWFWLSVRYVAWAGARFAFRVYMLCNRATSLSWDHLPNWKRQLLNERYRRQKGGEK